MLGELQDATFWMQEKWKEGCAVGMSEELLERQRQLGEELLVRALVQQVQRPNSFGGISPLDSMPQSKKPHTAVDLPSNTLGSDGGGPSIAQRLDSYLDRMNDSILLGTPIHYEIRCHPDQLAEDILIGRLMSSFQMCFPVQVGALVTPFLDRLG